MMVLTRAMTEREATQREARGDDIEWIEGVPYDVAAAFSSSRLAHFIGNCLSNYAEPRGLGEVVGADCTFVLSRMPRTELLPDTAFLRTDRVPVGDDEMRVIDGVPDLAVEVRSPSDRMPDQRDKMRRYMEAGTQLGWLIDSVSQTVEVWRPDADPQTLGRDDTLDGDDVIPGLRLPIARLLACDATLLRTLFDD